MPVETGYKDRFLKCLPRLLADATFRDEVTEGLGEEGAEILERVLKNLPIDEGDEDDLVDLAHEVYTNCAKEVLTLGWDGGAPGMSGVVWISCCGGVYVIGSSDYDDLGPFLSLEEALQEECFNLVSAKPELHSEVLSKKKLVDIAKQVVDWENEGTITINSELYQASGNKLALGIQG